MPAPSLPYLEGDQVPTSTEWNLMCDAILANYNRVQIRDKGTHQFVTSSTSLVDATGLYLTLNAGRLYHVYAKLFYAADASGDFKPGFTGPAGLDISYALRSLPSTAAVIGDWQPTALTASGAIIAGGIGNGSPLTAVFDATVHTDSAGTFQLQVAQGSSNVNFTVLYANSMILGIEA